MYTLQYKLVLRSNIVLRMQCLHTAQHYVCSCDMRYTVSDSILLIKILDYEKYVNSGYAQTVNYTELLV